MAIPAPALSNSHSQMLLPANRSLPWRALETIGRLKGTHSAAFAFGNHSEGFATQCLRHLSAECGYIIIRCTAAPIRAPGDKRNPIARRQKGSWHSLWYSPSAARRRASSPKSPPSECLPRLFASFSGSKGRKGDVIAAQVVHDHHCAVLEAAVARFGKVKPRAVLFRV